MIEYLKYDFFVRYLSENDKDMITYKPIIIQGGRRRDGTYPVKIRVTFKGVVRRLPTTLVCTDSDITRSGRIKNAAILERAGELIARMRAACDDLSPFALEGWSVDDVVTHIRERLTGESFRLDFFTFADGYILGKTPSTRRTYSQALNTLERFLGSRQLDVNDITRAMLIDFAEFIDAEPKMQRTADGVRASTRAKTPGGVSALYTAKLAHIFSAAKWKYNDEDAGRILIPRSPFDKLRKAYPVSHGQEPLPVEVVQRIIDASGRTEGESLALALFIISFATMGANMADLWAAADVKGGVWTYSRQKTALRRTDRAQVRVSLSPRLRPFLANVNGHCDGTGVWLPAVRRWRDANSATAAVNRQLRAWAQREGLPPFTFYAARHTWATLARQLGVEKATVDEALGHVGDFPVADIYAQRNWSLAWAANERVLDLFSWPDPDAGEPRK